MKGNLLPGEEQVQCYICLGNGHEANCPNETACFECKQIGHVKENCPKRRIQEENMSEESTQLELQEQEEEERDSEPNEQLEIQETEQEDSQANSEENEDRFAQILDLLKNEIRETYSDITESEETEQNTTIELAGQDKDLVESDGNMNETPKEQEIPIKKAKSKNRKRKAKKGPNPMPRDRLQGMTE